MAGSFKVVTQLRNRGILLEFDSEEAMTQFYSSEGLGKTFSTKFHKSTTIKPSIPHSGSAHSAYAATGKNVGFERDGGG